MTSQDRATLAFKVAGLVLITHASYYLGLVYSFFEILVYWLRGQGGGRPGYLATAAATRLGIPGAFLLGGALLIGFARPISSRLLKPSETGPEPLPQELLRIGLVVLGVYWLFGMVVALPLALHSYEASRLLSFAPVGAIALLLLAWPRLPASVLYRRVAVPGQHEAGRPPMLALGIAMLCTYFALRRISFIASVVSQMLAEEAAVVEQIAVVRRWLVDALLIESGGLILVVIVAFYAGRLGAWLGGPRGPAGERSLPRVRLSGRTYLTLAIFVSVAYLFVYHLGYLVRSPLFAWRGTEALGALVHLAVVPTVVALAAFALAGRYGWRLGAWLWSRESAEQQDGPSGAALIVAEVGITVVALLTVTNCFAWVATAKLWEVLPSAGMLGARWIGHYLPVGVAAAGMLLFRGDLAWLLCRRKVPQRPISPLWRASLLRPWIVLLGFWFVLADGAATLLWIGRVFFLLEQRGGPRLSVAAGLLLIFAAPWLSDKLSYGRLLPRLWPARPGMPGPDTRPADDPTSMASRPPAPPS